MSFLITAAVLDRVVTERPYGLSKPLRLAKIALADPKPGELLVRIDAAGLCHSDLSVINGDRPRPTPMVLGHEAAATVVTANAAEGFSPGDRVVLAFLPACGHCVDCASGHGFLCAPAGRANGEGRLLLGGRRLCEDVSPVNHHLGVSAFATHAVIDARSAVKVDADIPAEIAALFGCAVLTGVGAVLNTARMRAGQTLAVYGLGGVGLSAVLGGLAGGGRQVIAVDPAPSKRELALSLGASAALDPHGAVEQIKALSAGGVDIVVETVGNAAVLSEAYGAARRGGKIVTVGLPNPAQNLTLSAASLVAEAKTIMGSYMGSSIPSRDIPAYIALWRAGRLPVDRLLSAVGPLSKINEMMDGLADGLAVRQVVTP